MADTIDFSSLESHRSYLLKVARLQLRNEAQAEDLVADTLLVAFEKRESFRGASSMRTWLTAILKNKMVDALRKSWREESIDAIEEVSDRDFDSLFDATDHWIDQPSACQNPEKLCQQNYFLEAVQWCVDRLPKRVGQVFVLREVFEADTEEICKELTLSASNVWVQLYRARMLLRVCLEKRGFAPEKIA